MSGINKLNIILQNHYAKAAICSGYGFIGALLAKAPTLGILSKGTIGAIPAALTAITHSACESLEAKGKIAPGRAKQISTIASLAYAAVTYGIVVGLGVATPFAALAFIAPTLIINAYFNIFLKSQPHAPQALRI